MVWVSVLIWELIRTVRNTSSTLLHPHHYTILMTFGSATTVNFKFIAILEIVARALRGARWPNGLQLWLGLATGRSRPDSNAPAENVLLRNFGNSVYPALPVSFGGYTKSRRSLLSGVYARGSKSSYQSALECVTVVDSTTLREGQL